MQSNSDPHKPPARKTGRQLYLASALFIVLVLLALTVISRGWFGINRSGLNEATTGASATTTSFADGVASSTSSATTAPRIMQAASPTPLVYVGNPAAPQPPPSRVDPASRYYTETGHFLSGDFLRYYDNTPKSETLLGLPLTEAFPEQFPGGAVYQVQYFERGRLEYHPESAQRIELGLLASAMLKGRTFSPLPTLADTKTRVYFPQTGHTISNGFLNYWKANGSLATFGYPLSEEMGEDGLTVQYFERARFEYHKELEGTPYAVQLSPVGYTALKAESFNIPLGTLVQMDPPRVAEGHTTEVEVAATAGLTVTGQYEGRELFFKYDPARGVAWSLIGAVPFADTGTRQVTISLKDGAGGERTVSRNLTVGSYPFPSESLQFDPATSTLLDPAITSKELKMLNGIFAGRTPVQYWSGPFSMPLDGQIRITSYFATRRCYNCPDVSTPTTYHGGMDMAASIGTSVRAPADAKVVFAGELSDRGNTIILDHGLGVYSLLAHNSKLTATVGQMVRKGDVVSLSGNSGLSTGPHLHWELHVSGPPVDPREWVARSLP
ncbi:MAG: M23 family metallopeptidase [Chloroflexi bacterium]|nr:M23 family metallopeptidase [Chloroflexota bacterium]